MYLKKHRGSQEYVDFKVQLLQLACTALPLITGLSCSLFKSGGQLGLILPLRHMHAGLFSKFALNFFSTMFFQSSLEVEQFCFENNTTSLQLSKFKVFSCLIPSCLLLGIVHLRQVISNFEVSSCVHFFRVICMCARTQECLGQECS